jgi:hypothetical protein
MRPQRPSTQRDRRPNRSVRVPVGIALVLWAIASSKRGPSSRRPVPNDSEAPPLYPLGDPTTAAWREEALTKATELDALTRWVQTDRDAIRNGTPDDHSTALVKAITAHLEAARKTAAEEDPKRKLREWVRSFGGGSTFERTLGNLDAAETYLLRLAPAGYLRGLIPSLEAHVNRFLPKNDPRRVAFDSLVGRLKDGEKNCLSDSLTNAERSVLVATFHAANSQRRRELLRVRSFRNVLFAAAGLLTIVAVGLGLLGWFRPHLVPICFEPDKGAPNATIVCPTNQNPAPKTSATGGASAEIRQAQQQDSDRVIARTVTRWDIWLIEILGLVAAALGSAFALRNLRGTSTPYKIPVALAVLKLPTGAVTAVLGLLLMRGAFVPGLSALDTPAQILSWAIVFGSAQQLFTRFVDQQGQTVLESVGGRGAAGEREVGQSAHV